MLQVMVMSAGQRTYLLSRADESGIEALRKANDNFDNGSLDQFEADDDETQRDYPPEDYEAYPQASDKGEQTSTAHRTRIRRKNKTKGKRYKSKAHATQSSIGAKLKNLSVVHDTMAS
jgi:hypothetical protein